MTSTLEDATFPQNTSAGQQESAEILQLVEEFSSILWTKSSSLASWVLDYTQHALLELDRVYIRRQTTTTTTSNKTTTHPQTDCVDTTIVKDNASEDSSTCSITNPSDTDEELGSDGDDGFQSEHLGQSLQYWRDIVLGVNDGLVSTFLLVAGVTGAGLSNEDILLTAISGAIAGAISMAAGEYIATKTQEEVFDGEVGIERKHIAHHRDRELLELGECFEKIGIVSDMENEQEEVEDLRKRLMKFYSKHDNAHLLAHMVLEFGILEDEKRNPIIAASIAFILFGCGALPSVIPFVFFENITIAFILAGVSAVAGLLLVGAIKTWATRGNWWNAAIENLSVSAGGGAVAFAVGYAFELLVRGDGAEP